MILEYSDVLTATFTCTTFGGDDAPLAIDWLSPAGVTGLNISSRIDGINADNSTTSSITTLPLSLSDRGSMYACDVTYEGAPSDVTDALASVDIGEYTCKVNSVNNDLMCYLQYQQLLRILRTSLLELD